MSKWGRTPEEGEYAIEHWTLEPWAYNISTLVIEGAELTEKMLAAIAGAASVAYPEGNPVVRMRINRFVDGAWKTLGVWSAESGVHWHE
jgi:hypothetical protein